MSYVIKEKEKKKNRRREDKKDVKKSPEKDTSLRSRFWYEKEREIVKQRTHLNTPPLPPSSHDLLQYTHYSV